MYVSSLSLVALLFLLSKRSWAIGCTNTGGSVGDIVFTYMLRGLIPIIGLTWMVRAVALVNLVLAVSALAIILSQYSPRQHKQHAPIDIKALKYRHFMLFRAGLLFNYVGFYIPAFYTPIFTTAKLWKSREFGFDCLAFISVGSFTGRTLPMLIAGRIGNMSVYLSATVGTVVLLFAWIIINSAGAFIAFCLLYGLVSGVMVSGPSAAVPHSVSSPSLQMMATRMSMSWMFGAVGVLMVAPGAGALFVIRRAFFTHGQILGGIIPAMGALSLFGPILEVARYKPVAEWAS